MTASPISGACPPRFAAVRAAFEANFAEGQELGARFCLAIDGAVVVDLIGGFADRARTRTFDAATLTPVYSTTKAMAALLIARLVGQGRLSYGQTVAEVWPEFGQAGKEAVTVEQALSHQAGLAGFPEAMDPALWFDWEAICARLAAMAGAERIRGQDLVLPYAMSWGAGFMRNVPNLIYGTGRDTFGHSGWGGSCVFADPARRVSGAYVMNRQSAELIGDPRARRLIDAAYEGL